MGKKWMWLFLSVFVLALALSGCATAAQQEAIISNDMQKHFLSVQPPPQFDYSLERYLMSELYKSRNQAVSTFSYVWNPYLGKITWECASIGFPIPGGTQLTNPMQYSSSGPLPMIEPNGLYSPATSAGTYVMCLNADGTVGPSYIEENVMAFPQPYMEQDGHLMKVPDQSSTIKIPIQKKAP
jgi:hypothetical protein